MEDLIGHFDCDLERKRHALHLRRKEASLGAGQSRHAGGAGLRPLVGADRAPRARRRQGGAARPGVARRHRVRHDIVSVDSVLCGNGPSQVAIVCVLETHNCFGVPRLIRRSCFAHTLLILNIATGR